MKKGWKIVIIIVGILVAVALLIQLVPYGRAHANPAVMSQPNWDSPQTEKLAKAACYDCHSNETVWPWYSNIAPVSWLLQRDVDEGRGIVNFSDWNTFKGMASDMANEIKDSAMPPFYYVWMHPAAKLSDADRQTLIQGLLATGQK